MNAKTLRRRAETDYAHRVAADPGQCPVCCGDRRTTDRRYAAGDVIPGTDNLDRYFSPLYACALCAGAPS